MFHLVPLANLSSTIQGENWAAVLYINNIFDTRNDIITAHNMGIKYVPDFITNCGGVVAVALDFEKKDYKSALTTTLAKRINTILDISKDENIPIQHAAERLANDRLK